MRGAQIIAVLIAMTLVVTGILPAAAQDDPGVMTVPAQSFPELDEVPDTDVGHVMEVMPGSGREGLDLDVLARRAGELPSAKTIFHPDDRVRISPPAPPVALLIAFDRAQNPLWSCTAAMIGPRVALTGAHCLYNPSYGWPADIVIAPGVDVDVFPFGAYFATHFAVSIGWRSGFNPEWDWGVVRLTDTVGYQTGWLELGVLSAASLLASDLQPLTIGYPGDKYPGTQWATQKPALLDVSDTLLATDLDAYAGQSGSPVLRESDGRVIGVLTGESSIANLAVRVHVPMVNDIAATCIEIGCAFSSWVEPAPNVPNPADAFARTWARTDAPVAVGVVSRTWMWGPEPFAGDYEPYAESPGGQRAVAYLDKSRMEVSNPYGDQSSPWYVTNGLLVSEMIVGLLQTGDASYEPRSAAAVNIAGDPDDIGGPLYNTFQGLLTAPALNSWQTINQRVDRAGNVWVDPNMDWYGVTAAYLVEVPNLRHQVASPFWEFMNSSGIVFDGNSTTWAQLFENPFYATGYPITEAYWSTVKVGGSQKDVLIQCFQRRCLTYTPSNPAGWEVEAGNVGQHYYIWRYGAMP